MRCPHLDELPAAPPSKTGWPWTVASPAVATGPRVSIVTPAFNQAPFIEETIRSVLLQGYPDLEYIIIDGGSTDGTVDIIRKYEPWLTFWVSEKDEGQSAAINKGWQRATGTIVAFLNSDDTYLPGALATVAPLFTQHTATGLIYGNGQVIDEAGNVLRDRRPGPVKLANLLAWSPSIPQPCMFISRQALDSVGPLRTDLHYTMDYDLTLRIASRFPLQYTDHFLATMRGHAAAKTTVAPEEHVNEGLRVTEEFFNTHLDPSIQALKPVSLASLYLRQARVLSWFNRKALARQCIVTALRTSCHPRVIVRATTAYAMTIAGAWLPTLRLWKSQGLAIWTRTKLSRTHR